jgi:aromatic-L-amino-acid/L-tryptophan decarboxylase
MTQPHYTFDSDGLQSELAGMSPSEFRTVGRQLVDWIADYHDNLEELEVQPKVWPGQIYAGLQPEPPVSGRSFESLMSDFSSHILPGVMHWQHPRFFGYFPANFSFPAVLGELLSAGLGVQGMSWSTSPAATEVETLVLDWLAGLLGLPETFLSTTGVGGGVIQDSASSSVLVALIGALNRASAGKVREDGIEVIHEPRVYASPEAHSSLEKALVLAGIGRKRLIAIKTDSAGRIDVESLTAALEDDVACGFTPVMVMGTVGSTSNSVVDKIAAIGQVCAARNVWLHVDAAYAGSAAVCPEFRWVNDGLDMADSYCTNPHKWLLTNFDCSALFVRDRRDIVNALTINPEYLKNSSTDSGAVIDYRDWQIPLGRRFRALKLWFTISMYGADGLRAHIRRHVELAQKLATWINMDDRLSLVGEHPLSLVCFRVVGDDSKTEELLRNLNDDGFMYVTQTRVDGLLTIRVAIGGTYTTERHVTEAWHRIVESLDSMHIK